MRNIRIGHFILEPLKGDCQEFHQEVKNLERPYVSLHALQYQRLLKTDADFLKVVKSDKKDTLEEGRVVTYGTADNGYALMPISAERAREILEKQQ